MADALTVPHDEQLETDLLAALAREGDARHLFGWLEPSDFYRYAWLYELLAEAHGRHQLRCEADDVGTGWRWRHLSLQANHALNRLCPTARTLGSRRRAAEHLRKLALDRAVMRTTVDLHNAVGTGDEAAAAEARARLLELTLATV